MSILFLGDVSHTGCWKERLFGEGLALDNGDLFLDKVIQNTIKGI